MPAQALRQPGTPHPRHACREQHSRRWHEAEVSPGSSAHPRQRQGGEQRQEADPALPGLSQQQEAVMSVHTDCEGPYLFVGGCANGARYSVNRSRDVWVVPNAYDPSEVDTYTKRTLVLGSPEIACVAVTVMVC